MPTSQISLTFHSSPNLAPWRSHLAGSTSTSAARQRSSPFTLLVVFTCARSPKRVPGSGLWLHGLVQTLGCCRWLAAVKMGQSVLRVSRCQQCTLSTRHASPWPCLGESPTRLIRSQYLFGVSFSSTLRHLSRNHRSARPESNLSAVLDIFVRFLRLSLLGCMLRLGRACYSCDKLVA